MGSCKREAERLARPGEGEREERIVLVWAENRDLFIFFQLRYIAEKKEKYRFAACFFKEGEKREQLYFEGENKQMKAGRMAHE